MVDAFDICFLTDEFPPDAPFGRFGRITIGTFRERFLIDTTWWTQREYERQWIDAMTQVLANEVSALVTSIAARSSSPIVRWWAMYPVGDLVVLQDQLFFQDQIDEPFVASMTGRFVRPRETVADTGEPVSEWSIDRAALQNHVFKAKAAAQP